MKNQLFGGGINGAIKKGEEISIYKLLIFCREE